MENVTFVEIETLSGTQTHAIIEHADGSFTSMTKEHYDKQQAEQSTPIVINEAETI
jgi:hypothetical protein